MTKDWKLSIDSANSIESVSRLALFGPPPLLAGEDVAAYDELLARVSGCVKPANIIEEIWVRDIVDLTWENLRWRRVKKLLVAEGLPYALRETIAPLVDEAENSEWMDTLMNAWIGQKPSAIKRVYNYLASAKLTFEAVVARAISNCLDDIERIDRLIAISESRRNAILREIDRRRAPFAQILRSTVRNIEATEFETVKPKAIEQNTAAGKNAA